MKTANQLKQFMYSMYCYVMKKPPHAPRRIVLAKLLQWDAMRLDSFVHSKATLSPQKMSCKKPPNTGILPWLLCGAPQAPQQHYL